MLFQKLWNFESTGPVSNKAKDFVNRGSASTEDGIYWKNSSIRITELDIKRTRRENI